VFYLLTRVLALLFSKSDLKSFFSDLDLAFSEGIERGRTRIDLILATLLLVALDWAAMIVSLNYCFAAFGPALAAGKLVSGFTVGIAAGALSLIPGGIGVQDGSMAGIFVIFGAPLEQAILALVLFRVLFYLLPFGVSFFFYNPAIGKTVSR